jgi:hypothetical protein
VVVAGVAIADVAVARHKPFTVVSATVTVSMVMELAEIVVRHTASVDN